MSNALDSIFNRIGSAKEINDYAPRLDTGKHKVALKRFAVKQSSKDGSNILEADFVVLESDTHTVGQTLGWVWFLSGQWANYAEARAKSFIETIGQCIGDTETPPAQLGQQLASEEQPGKGIVLDVEVWIPRDANNQPKKSKGKGNEIKNVTWTAVSQTGEEIVAMRAKVENTKEPEVGASTATAGTSTAQPAGGGLGSLLKNVKR